MTTRNRDPELEPHQFGQQFAAALTGTATVDAALASAQTLTQREMARAGYK